MLPIVVTTLAPACSATLALTMEGLTVTEYVIRPHDPYHYGSILTSIWQRGHGFVLIEGDVVPWPGAIKELVQCKHDWCCFEYPTTLDSRCNGLGCMKFSGKMVRHIPFNSLWQTTAWDSLDGIVHETLELAGENVHTHTPMVAHVKAVTLTIYQ
jgi:hypothetical protein